MTNTAELAVAAPESLEAEAQRQADSLEGRRKRIVTGLGFAGLALAGGLAEKYHLMGGLPDAAETIGKTLKHPVLGYAAAWAAFRWSNRRRLATSFAAASAADYIVEAGQAVIFDPDHDPFEPLAHDALQANAEDYGAALAGMVWFFVQNRTYMRRLK
ncbi:hypothetical protein HYS84_00195 [Candidatus Saccharibacteria bacterium]|nr:hypothetical protein [Candidatus Saccharibacteria bacterium]